NILAALKKTTSSLSYFCCDKTTSNRHPEDLSLRTLCNELKVSKNRLHIRQVEWRVGSWVEPMPPLKVMDNQLGETDAWNHNQSGPLFP
nr:hypothetical protein [Tanacetum cinerariifolium]